MFGVCWSHIVIASHIEDAAALESALFADDPADPSVQDAMHLQAGASLSNVLIEWSKITKVLLMLIIWRLKIEKFQRETNIRRRAAVTQRCRLSGRDSAASLSYHMVVNFAKMHLESIIMT